MTNPNTDHAGILMALAGVIRPDNPEWASLLMDASDALRKWEYELSKVMPPDYTGWWENSRSEWPVVARATIESIRGREESMAESALRLAAEKHRLREALSELVKTNEQHNEAVEAVIGRPLNWNDSYLDKARTVLAGTAAKEDTDDS